MNQIRCARLPRFRSKEKLPYPRLENFRTVNVCSSAVGWSRALSPVMLGPIVISESSKTPGFSSFINDKREECYIAVAANFELLWQNLKRSSNETHEQYLQRRGKVFTNFAGKKVKASDCRHIIAKSTMLYSYFDGHILSYLEARLLLYCHGYEALVSKTDAYQQLKSMCVGSNVLIVGYDARDVPVTLDSMTHEILNTQVPFGHELVLACMLANIRPWADPRVLTAARGNFTSPGRQLRTVCDLTREINLILLQAILSKNKVDSKGTLVLCVKDKLSIIESLLTSSLPILPTLVASKGPAIIFAMR